MFNSHLKAKNEKEKQLASLKLSLQHFQKIVEDAQNQRKVVKQTEEIQQRVELLKLQFKKKHEIIASIKKVTEIFKNTELHVKTAEKNKRKVKTQALKKSPTKLNPSKTIKIDDNSLTQQKLEPLNELSEQEEFSEDSSSIKEKGSTVRLGSEIDTSSANTEAKKSQMDIDPSKLLKKNTLRKRNDNFGTNPYYPDYFGKREKEIEDIRDESGIELEYISDQRKYKPADIARDMLMNANKSTKLTQINSFTFKTDNYEDKFQDKIAQKEYKEHREMSDKLSLLKTIAGIESKRPEIITKNKRIAHSIISPKKGCTRNFNAKFWTFMSSLPSVDKNIRNETLIEQTPGFSKKPTMISKTWRKRTNILNSPTKGNTDMSGFGGRTIRSIERNYSRPWATRMSNRALSSVQIRRPGTKTEEMRSELREMIQKSVQHGSSIKDKARINFASNLV